MGLVKRDYRKMAVAAAAAAAEKKAVDIVVLDIRKESDVADYVVVAGAESTTQMRAVDEAVQQELKKAGLRPLRRDGPPGSRWIALDYGGLVMHILLPEARQFYRLESLWEKPHLVKWES